MYTVSSTSPTAMMHCDMTDDDLQAFIRQILVGRTGQDGVA
jgi:hypothetical protein